MNGNFKLTLNPPPDDRCNHINQRGKKSCQAVKRVDETA